ncbi:N-formylglutamate amidohydrolase [Magnetospira thiophila]
MFHPDSDLSPLGDPRIDPPLELLDADPPRGPLILASPHSGRIYPPAFVRVAKLDPTALRRSEDAFVEELFEAAPGLGIPLLKAHFPRVYLDPNREPWEMDPLMFDGPLPAYVNTASPRVAAGLGTVAKVVTDGAQIYGTALPFDEARWRVKTYYEPYHAALLSLIERTRDAFGTCLLVDCHSMPSVGGSMDPDRGRRRADFVLGDGFGETCAPSVLRRVETVLGDLGYRVVRNIPYSGGHTTRHYGRPEDRVYALQIEINRDLYMDEAQILRRDNLPRLREHLTTLIDSLADLEI